MEKTERKSVHDREIGKMTSKKNQNEEEKKECIIKSEYREVTETREREKNRYETRPRRPFMPLCVMWITFVHPALRSSILFYVRTKRHSLRIERIIRICVVPYVCATVSLSIAVSPFVVVSSSSVCLANLSVHCFLFSLSLSLSLSYLVHLICSFPCTLEEIHFKSKLY